MDSDDDTRMDDNEPINWPNTTKGKGKGKATQHEDSAYDVENLPWCVSGFCTLVPLTTRHASGWRSTAQIRWTTLCRITTSQVQVSVLTRLHQEV